jgi:CheY-like chemotaxis protein
LRILIAEDNTVNQSVALQQLRQLGYEADVVSNGREALGAVEQYAYDVILMDVQMPEMDGLEATRRIKRAAHQGALTGAPESATSAPPHVIAITASALKDDRAQCFDAGMDDYERQPVTVNALADALRRAPTRETPSQDGGA